MIGVDLHWVVATILSGMTALPPLAVIGFGAMGSAIVAGCLRARLTTPARVVVAEADEGRRTEAAGLRMVAVADGGEALNRLASIDPAGVGQVLLAVKPQMLDVVAALIGPVLKRTPRVVVSIMAGTATARLEAALPGARVVRTMPNLGVRVGNGCTAACSGASARPGDDACARAVFSALGEVFSTPESLMDAFTAVAGSGPAYLFYLAEAMERGAMEVGFDPVRARELVRATLVGAADLLAEGGDPAALRAAVTSKGGTTAAAVGVLDEAAVMRAWVRAMVAARDRGRALNA